jgi:hypothetical protein
MQALETAQAQAGIDHGLSIVAHFAGSARMKDRYAVRAQIIFPLPISRDIRSRRQFRDHMLGKRRSGIRGAAPRRRADGREVSV